MRITWKIEKKRGNLRPVLTYTVTLEDFERQLATPPLSITSLIPEPPESWQEHCWPGQHERAGQDDAGERPCYQLSIPSHKGRHGSQSLRLPWREDNSYPEVEASFRLLREAFASELERAGASRPMHEENSLELGGTAHPRPAFSGSRGQGLGLPGIFLLLPFLQPACRIAMLPDHRTACAPAGNHGTIRHREP